MRQPLLQELVTEEERLIQQAVRAFVDSKIMPVRQQLDDDKDHVLIDKISEKLKNLGFQRSVVPETYGGLPQRSVVGTSRPSDFLCFLVATTVRSIALRNFGLSNSPGMPSDTERS